MLNQNKIKVHFKYLLFILISSIYANLDYGINYELRYSDGEIEETNFFENYFDINLYYKDLYLYTLLIHKDPPLIGSSTKSMEDMLSTIYLEYSNNRIEIQLGDIYQSYGAGLSMHTFEDRNIDYNNSPRGISVLYYLRDNIDLFASFGQNIFKTRTNPTVIEPDISIDNNLKLAGFAYQNDYFDMHYLSMLNDQNIDAATIERMMSLDTPLGEYLSEDRYPNSQVTPSDFSMRILEHNLGSTIYLGDLELYFERSWIYHNKIEAERTDGYKSYFSSYFSISDYGILYEYKDYNSPYYFSVYSNPPIVFKENSSTLISRNLHNIDFSNEVGHHILVNKSFSEQINVILSSAFSFNPIRDNNKRFGFGRIFKEMFNLNILEEEFDDFTPYRQVYLEVNGWSKDEKVAYKVGLDDYYEYIPGKKIHSTTCPSQITYKFSEGNSMTVYLEYQKKNDLLAASPEISRYFYFSPSYNHFGKWIVTLFGDFESKLNSPVEFDNLKEEYFGLDITYYMSNNNIVSLFFGSQKGGLVCANGTCIVQPDFKNGFKITSRMIF
tara:strand:+ start:504 stop:2162 length:1659 start_codon:yes stop_codon:yes gene_type:complete